MCDVGEGCLLQDICFYTGISKQTVNSALRKLEVEEILYLEPYNAKSKKVFLTSKSVSIWNPSFLQTVCCQIHTYAFT